MTHKIEMYQIQITTESTRLNGYFGLDTVFNLIHTVLSEAEIRF